ncbi:MAG: lysophospholipid acyltransferase family protein, partial [Akkermansia sp.]|nr:lysophospholipid acyltransferase family protein [Akkermansia sp.]
AATWSWKDRRVVDDPWQVNISAVIRKTGATVVPMHFSGSNGVFFQTVSVLAKGIRSNFLAREILRDGKTRHKATIGKPIAPSIVAATETNEELSDFLRLNTMALRYPQNAATTTAPTDCRESIAPSSDAAAMQAEIDALPVECYCAGNERAHLHVYAADAAQIPHIMHEIGVQREHTFRAVGEGTGKAIDLDEYDPHYVHLIMWDSAKKCLAGAYRIGRTDVILDSPKGKKGIYNAAFFEFKPKLL